MIKKTKKIKLRMKEKLKWKKHKQEFYIARKLKEQLHREKKSPWNQKTASKTLFVKYLRVVWSSYQLYRVKTSIRIVKISIYLIIKIRSFKRFKKPKISNQKKKMNNSRLIKKMDN